MEKRNENGLSGVISLTASALFVKILGFLYKIPLSHILTDEGMGYYNGALNVYALFFILSSCAIPKTLSIILTKARMYQSKKAYRQTLLFLTLIICAFGLSMTVLLTLYSRKIAVLLGITNASLALLYISPSVVLSTLGSLCRGYLLSYDKVASVGIAECIEAFSKLFGGIIFVYVGVEANASLPTKSALAVLGITLGSLLSFLYLLLTTLFLKHKETVFYAAAPFSAVDTLLKLIKISLPLMLSGLLFSISAILDVRLISGGLVKSGVSAQEAVSMYGNYSTLVLPLLSFVNSLANAFSLSLFPRLCKSYENKDENSFKRTLRSALTILFCFSLCVSAGFYFFGEDYFMLLFHKDSVALGTHALKVVSVSVVFISMLSLLNTALEARGKTSAPLLTLGISMLIKIPTEMRLIQSFGIIGAAYSTVVCYGIAFLISFILLSKEISAFMPSIKALGSCSLCVLFCFSIGLLSKNIANQMTDSNMIHLVPIVITAVLFVIFLLFISKTLPKNIHTLSQYTK